MGILQAILPQTSELLNLQMLLLFLCCNLRLSQTRSGTNTFSARRFYTSWLVCHGLTTHTDHGSVLVPNKDLEREKHLSNKWVIAVRRAFRNLEVGATQLSVCLSVSLPVPEQGVEGACK
jgi:hypothetical protein